MDVLPCPLQSAIICFLWPCTLLLSFQNYDIEGDNLLLQYCFTFVVKMLIDLYFTISMTTFCSFPLTGSSGTNDVICGAAVETTVSQFSMGSPLLVQIDIEPNPVQNNHIYSILRPLFFNMFIFLKSAITSNKLASHCFLFFPKSLFLNKWDIMQLMFSEYQELWLVCFYDY